MGSIFRSSDFGKTENQILKLNSFLKFYAYPTKPVLKSPDPKLRTKECSDESVHKGETQRVVSRSGYPSW